MQGRFFKITNIVCLVFLVLMNIPSAVLNDWLGHFGLVKNEAQAGIIGPIDESDWQILAANALQKKNPDGSYTAKFYENKRYVYYQGQWQDKKDLLKVSVGDNAEIIFSYADKEFKLVPYVYFNGEKYLYDTLNPILKEQIDLKGEIKDTEQGKKWLHALNKITNLEKISFAFTPADLITEKNKFSIIVDDFLPLNFSDLAEAGYQLELTNQELMVAGLTDGINILDPTTFYSTDAADGYISAGYPSGTPQTAYPSATLDYIGSDYTAGPFPDTGTDYRSYYSFDTSALPDGALSSLSAADLYIYADDYVTFGGLFDPVDIWLANYYCDTDDIGASLDTTDWGLSSPSLCVTGKDWAKSEGWKTSSITSYVTKTGDTDIEIRPAWGGVASKYYYMKGRDTAYSGTGSDPYLSVTYTYYNPVQKNWRFYDDEWDFRSSHTYTVDNYDAQAYASCDTDGVFAGSETEFVAGNYTSISLDDANYVETGNDIEPEYAYHRFVLTIDESTSDIYKVDVTWKGYGRDDDAVNGHSLWVKESGTWTERDSGTSSSSETLTYSYTSGFANIISANTMEVAAQVDVNSGGWDYLRSYYAEVKVYYNTLNEDLGAENTPAYKNNLYWGQLVKLRTTISETGALGLDNSRKRLRFSTDEANWTNVDESTETDTAWRYGDAIKCGGDDDALLPVKLLSDATAVATHNETGTGASTYDHAASTAAEWEFCLENYSATPGTLYYFQVYDANVGAVALDSGETHPQLTTSEVPVRSGIEGAAAAYAANTMYDDYKLAMKFLAPDDLADWKLAFWGYKVGTISTDLLAVSLCEGTETDSFDVNCQVLETVTINPSASKTWQADMTFAYDLIEGNYYWLHFYENGTEGTASNNYYMRTTDTRLKKEKAQSTANAWSTSTEGGSAVIRIKDSGGTDKRIYPTIVTTAVGNSTANDYEIYQPRANLAINYVYLKTGDRTAFGGDLSLSICNHDTGCGSNLATGTASFANTKGVKGWVPIKLNTAITLTGGTNYRIVFVSATASDWYLTTFTLDPSSESLGGTTSYAVINNSGDTTKDWAFRLANHSLNVDQEMEDINASYYSTEDIKYGVAGGGKWAFRITPTSNGTLSSVSIIAFKGGSPSDNLKIALQADSSGNPSGTDLESVSIAGSSLTTTPTWTDFSGYTYSLTASTDYWVVITRSGTLSTTNYYRIRLLQHYNNLFPFKKYSGGAWGGYTTASTISAKVTTSAETFSQEFEKSEDTFYGTSNWQAQSLAPEVQKKVRGFLMPYGRSTNKTWDATATFSLYNDSSGSPGTEIANTASAIRRQYQDDVSTTGGLMIWEFPAEQTLSADTRYWIVAKATDGTVTNSSFWTYRDYRTETDSWKSTTETAKYTTDGGSAWSAESFDHDFWAIVNPYTPKSKDWRFYGDETSTTPSSPYAAEDTAPSGTIGDTDVFKLRMTLSENTGTGIANSKKRLQYDTTSDFSGSPTYVGESAAATIWRYSTSCGGSDNGVLAGTVISGSPSAGTYNESGTSTTTFDHEASALTEFEFCLQNNGATAATQYYFRVYDVVSDAAIATDTAETYPNLTTATYALDIQVEDNEIGFSNYTLGTTGSSSHALTSDEELIAADWTGAGSGWSLTASATNLAGVTYTIDNSAIDWVTGTITGLYGASIDSVTTACTAISPCNLDSEKTIMAAAAGYGKGGYSIQPTVTITLGDDEYVDNYTSTITLTLS